MLFKLASVYFLGMTFLGLFINEAIMTLFMFICFISYASLVREGVK